MPKGLGSEIYEYVKLQIIIEKKKARNGFFRNFMTKGCLHSFAREKTTLIRVQSSLKIYSIENIFDRAPLTFLILGSSTPH